MPFKFKLSRRLARTRPWLVATAVLALACELTDPASPTNDFTLAVTETTLVADLAVESVVASTDDGNIPQNTLDGSLDTRWSARGDGQWIRYDLGALATIGRVDIAWYLGDPQVNGPASFDIEVSPDTVTWTRVFSGHSSGQTVELETYYFSAASGRYIRIVGHGNTMNAWNSITEVAITVFTKLAVASVIASAHDGNVPQNTLDGSLSTRWSARGDGQWIQYDLGARQAIDRAEIAWYLGDPKINGPTPFDVHVSEDAVFWTRVFSGQSSAETIHAEPYDFPRASGRYVRIVGHGNSQNAWNSITETAVHRATTLAAAPPSIEAVAAVAWVTVSPASSTTLLGETQQFQAVTEDSAGNELTGRTVSWTTSDSAVATVSSDGLVTGEGAGTATITASSEGQSGSASASVTVPVIENPGTVVDLAVTQVTETSLTVAFTEVDDGTGRPASYDVRVAPAPLSWGGATSVTLGTCATPVAGTGIGVKRSCTVLGVAPGTTYDVQLVAYRGTLRLDAVFGGLSNVASGTTPADTDTGLGPEPGPGATIVFQDGFESGSLGQWEQIPATGRYSVTTNAVRVKSGTRSLQALYTPTNSYGMITRWFMPGYDEIYVKFHVMFEEGFEHGPHFLTVAGNRIDNNTSSFGKAGVKPDGTDFFYAGVDPEFIGDKALHPFSFYTYWPDMSCCYGNRFNQTSPKIPLIGGQWQEVVFHIKLNTPGQYNGSQTLWIDGVKKIDMQNMRWRTTTDLTLNQIRFDNWMPAGAAPKTQYIWVDDVTVWRP